MDVDGERERAVRGTGTKEDVVGARTKRPTFVGGCGARDRREEGRRARREGTDGRRED